MCFFISKVQLIDGGRLAQRLLARVAAVGAPAAGGLAARLISLIDSWLPCGPFRIA